MTMNVVEQPQRYLNNRNCKTEDEIKKLTLEEDLPDHKRAFIIISKGQ